jgi:hypothetical protein
MAENGYKPLDGLRFLEGLLVLTCCLLVFTVVFWTFFVRFVLPGVYLFKQLFVLTHSPLAAVYF